MSDNDGRLERIEERLSRSFYVRGVEKDWTSKDTYPAELQYLLSDLDWLAEQLREERDQVKKLRSAAYRLTLSRVGGPPLFRWMVPGSSSFLWQADEALLLRPEIRLDYISSDSGRRTA